MMPFVEISLLAYLELIAMTVVLVERNGNQCGDERKGFACVDSKLESEKHGERIFEMIFRESR